MGLSETNCRQVVESLFLFIDGEISGDEFGSIEMHIQRCAPCLDHVSFQRELKELVRRKCSEGAAPQDLATKLKLRLTQYLETVESQD